jgi:hypothetical protein
MADRPRAKDRANLPLDCDIMPRNREKPATLHWPPDLHPLSVDIAYPRPDPQITGQMGQLAYWSLAATPT